HASPGVGNGKGEIEFLAAARRFSSRSLVPPSACGPVSLLSIGLGGVHADGPGTGFLVRLHGPVDAAGGMFGAPAFEVVEGLGVGVEVLLGPGGAQVPLVGPFDAVPAVAAGGGSFGHNGESQPTISPAD